MRVAPLIAAVRPEMTFVIDLLIVLATAAIVAIFMRRMRLAVIAAYLIAGAIVGPGALGLILSPASLDAIARLAIVLLMFGIGMHMQLSVFGHSAIRMVIAGVASCAVSIAMGWPLAVAIGLSKPAALALCMALSISSTAVVLRVIVDRGELRHASGQLALAVLVIQDLIVLAMLAALPAIARWAGGIAPSGSGEVETELPGWGTFVTNTGWRIGGIAGLILFGRLILPRMLAEAARDRTGEVMVIVSVAVAIGAGLLTLYLKFSMELGAYLAGFLLASTPFRYQLAGQIAPLRNLFLAVFFTTLGMQLDPKIVIENWWIVLLAGAAMSMLKILAIGGTVWALGASAATAIAVGFALAQAGEFSLVLINSTVDQQIVDAETAHIAIAIVVISLILTPGLVEVGRRLSLRTRQIPHAPWIRTMIGDAERSEAKAVTGRHVILGGFGQVGRAVADALERAGIQHTVVEINPDALRHAKPDGRRVIFGDIANQTILESAGLDNADALILTMPDEQAVLAACAVARRKRGTSIFIAARFGMAHHSKPAHELGVDHITVEEIETAHAMEQAVMKHLDQK